MSQVPLNAILHVLVVGPYLCTSVWHATKGNVSLFKLVPQGVATIPHPSRPHAPSSNLGMDILNLDPLGIVLLGSQGLNYILHPSCFEAKGAINIQISFGSHSAKPKCYCYLASFSIFPPIMFFLLT